MDLGKPREQTTSVPVCAQHGAVLKADATRVGKYDEPTVEMEVVTLQRFEGKVQDKRDRGERQLTIG